ncbi:Hsp20/alpha crystallin family protein [Candidatus Woesebacteria bacterium]|nr:Hsp20/alpha crystallin family protein [Candidatus Woesebacteria bacterium]
MTKVRLTSPLARYMFRPMFDLDEEWPSMTMTEGLDIVEHQDTGTIEVKASVPGVQSENVDIEFEDGVLRIQAHQEESEEEKKEKKVVYKQERVVSFEYTTTLPRPVDPKTIQAEVKDGVLSVTAKIAESAQMKKIPVRASGK